MEPVATQSKKWHEKKSTFSRADVSLFVRSIITRRIDLPMVSVGKNLMRTFDAVVKSSFEGKCSVEGYIKPDSVSIISYSGGKTTGDMVSFTVIFSCDICTPVEDMGIPCVAINITKAGIRAESVVSPSPIVVFIARDHYYENDYFNSIKEGDHIMIRVIGCRYELHDRQISVIAEIVPTRTK
jgi:hypothetical protein